MKNNNINMVYLRLSKMFNSQVFGRQKEDKVLEETYFHASYLHLIL